MSFDKCIYSCNSTPLSIYRTFPSSQQDPLHSFQVNPPFPEQSLFHFYLPKNQFSQSRTSYKRSHTIYTLLCPVSFAQHFSEIHACDSLYQQFDPGQYSTVWLYYNLFIMFPVSEYLEQFQFGAFMNQAAINIHVQVSFWKYA